MKYVVSTLLHSPSSPILGPNTRFRFLFANIKLHNIYLKSFQENSFHIFVCFRNNKRRELVWSCLLSSPSVAEMSARMRDCGGSSGVDAELQAERRAGVLHLSGQAGGESVLPVTSILRPITTKRLYMWAVQETVKIMVEIEP